MENRHEIMNIIDEVHANIELRAAGKFPGIPYYKIYPRFGEEFPSLEKGNQGMLSASSGIGKTHWWIEMMYFQVFLLYKRMLFNGVDPGFKPLFKIALLENTKREFEYRVLSRIYAYLSGEIISAKRLRGRDSVPPPKAIIDEYSVRALRMFDDIMSITTVVDNITHPTGLYNWAKTESEKIGKHLRKEVTYTNEGVATKHIVYDKYVLNDPDTHVIMIMDNANNLSTEREGGKLLDERLTIQKWYRTYGRLQITKHWQWTLINIHQQAADTEKEEFQYGKSIASKLKPSTAGLGNNKECQRDCHWIWGLFSPSKYRIHPYERYDILTMKNHFRSLLLLKQNDGVADTEHPFYFHGGSSIFREMPTIDNITNEDISMIGKGQYKNIN